MVMLFWPSKCLAHQKWGRVCVRRVVSLVAFSGVILLRVAFLGTFDHLARRKGRSRLTIRFLYDPAILSYFLGVAKIFYHYIYETKIEENLIWILKIKLV